MKISPLLIKRYILLIRLRSIIFFLTESRIQPFRRHRTLEVALLFKICCFERWSFESKIFLRITMNKATYLESCYDCVLSICQESAWERVIFLSCPWQVENNLQIMCSSRGKALKCIGIYWNSHETTERKWSTYWVVITSHRCQQYVTKTPCDGSILQRSALFLFDYYWEQ